MDSKLIKEQLNDENIIQILTLLGSSYIEDNDDCIVSETICHHGDSHKLYYYKNSKTFQCYTECGCMDIFSLIQSSLGIDFYESIIWLQEHFNFKENINNISISDWDFINSYRKSKRKTFEDIETKIYNENILNIFQKIYYQGWINEGITIESMIKYNILYCDFNKQIIIPHYDIHNNLIGIRGRNLLESSSMKYIPFYDGNIIYKHNLSNYLYGLNMNYNTIHKKRKAMIVESEKAVMQCDSFFGEDNFTVALCGSHLSNTQLKLLLNLDVNEIIIALDKQWQEINDDKYSLWQEHILKIVQKITPYCRVSVLWDIFNFLDYKDSPTDKGKEILLKLLDNKISF